MKPHIQKIGGYWWAYTQDKSLTPQPGFSPLDAYNALFLQLAARGGYGFDESCNKTIRLKHGSSDYGFGRYGSSVHIQDGLPVFSWDKSDGQKEA